MFVCRMEEMVHSLLQNQTVDTVDIMKVYKVRLSPPSPASLQSQVWPHVVALR